MEGSIGEPTAGGDRPAFVYPHVVSFEETNLMRNVYYARLVAWQGRCRELFLKAHAPEVLDALAGDLRLVTLRVTCEFFDELHALEEVEVRMRLAHLRGHRIGLDFDYVVDRGGRKLEIAKGSQEVGCMRAMAQGLAPIPPPEALTEALRPYGARV